MTLPTIYLDMDGTIADLYSIPDWLSLLRSENSKPYSQAALLIDSKIISLLQRYIKKNGKISIISWTSKTGSPSYNKRVRAAKIYWLKKNLPLNFYTINIVKYGIPKSKFAENNSILFDDEEKNRKEFVTNGRIAFSPNKLEKIITSLLGNEN